MAATYEKVKEIIVERLSVDEKDVTQEASFIDDLGADSLDTVELVMALEEEFGMEIPDEEAEKIATVGRIRKIDVRIPVSMILPNDVYSARAVRRYGGLILHSAAGIVIDLPVGRERGPPVGRVSKINIIIALSSVHPYDEYVARVVHRH